MESILHYTSVSHSDNLLSTINKMRLDTDLCDVTIVIGNFRIMAHKLVLSASAPFFYEMFKPCETMKTNSEYHLQEVDEISALKIIEFCYTSAISLDKETAWPLLLAARKFGCSEITNLCCEFMTSALNLSTCIQIHLEAHRHSCASMLSSTSQFINDNYKKLKSHCSVLNLPSSDLMELMSTLKNAPSIPTMLHLKFAESWLQHNSRVRQLTAMMLIQEFPELSDDLYHYLTINKQVSSQQELLGNELSRQSPSIDHTNLYDQSVPLHICVSCGDAFVSQQQLSSHEKICDESVRPSSSSTQHSQKSLISNSDDTDSEKKTTVNQPDLENKSSSSVVQFEKFSAAPNPAELCDGGKDNVKTNSALEYKADSLCGSLDANAPEPCVSTLNDTNNNDISVDDTDDISEEIDVVNDTDEKEVSSDQCFKMNFLCDTNFDANLTLKCQICERTFTERKMLSNHWKCMHGIKEEIKENSNSQTSDKDDSGIADDSDLLQDQLAQSKKPRLEEEETLKKQDLSDITGFMQSDLLKQYLQQYNDFTRWYMEQGQTCQICSMYHAKGSICPINIQLNNKQASGMQNVEAGSEDSFETLTLESKKFKQDTCKVDEGPLDMSKHSSDYPNNSSVNSLTKGQSGSSSHSPYFPSPMDISQYYSNLGQIMATSQSHSSEKGEYSFLHPGVKPYLSYPPSSPFSMSFDPNIEASCYGSQSIDRSSPMESLMSLHHKKKVSPRQRLFPCTVCNRVFSYQAALFTHMRTHSPSVQTYQCSQCHQSFTNAQELKVHVCPNGIEKPYTCSSCGQTFAKNIHLKRHLATHSGLKPYPCWVCGKRFSRSDHLKRHTQSIHAGSRPHGCQVCGKEFVRKYELNKHLLSHNIDSTSTNSGMLDLSQSVHQQTLPSKD
ncbi:zinc finger protein 16 [Biomphalaria pfeifferi]|uniref:Zinc finger protein 16 n=1 Tax=Biomphalaria pfeifferi TaxID=112525 RepID=A0AAD8C529_BIOPF|nr:zinc finger protein 16 [Biomphalaria pfeifferi]